MKSWINKKLLILISNQILRQKNIICEMAKTQKTSYRYACLNVGFELCSFKIEILRELMNCFKQRR